VVLSNARQAEFLIVMAVTDPDVSAYRGIVHVLVPRDTPGVIIEREVGTIAEGKPVHALIHYDHVRLPTTRSSAAWDRPSSSRRSGWWRAHPSRDAGIGQWQRAFDMIASAP